MKKKIAVLLLDILALTASSAMPVPGIPQWVGRK
jgi:hypothetical protein